MAILSAAVPTLSDEDLELMQEVSDTDRFPLSLKARLTLPTHKRM